MIILLLLLLISVYSNLFTLNVINLFHYCTKELKHSFSILKAIFSSDTRQSMKRRITTEWWAEIYTNLHLVYISAHLSVIIRRFILWQVSDERSSFSMLKEYFRFFLQ